MPETHGESVSSPSQRPPQMSNKREGRVARSIEEQTAKLPSDTFLWMAIGSMVASAAFQISRAKHVSLFIGQWAPTFLILGIYNKLVKQLGSDRSEHAMAR